MSARLDPNVTRWILARYTKVSSIPTSRLLSNVRLLYVSLNSVLVREAQCLVILEPKRHQNAMTASRKTTFPSRICLRGLIYVAKTP